ncbi:MAG: hypothetical protein EA392_14040 [Cryomorphaceae bacterium]|nr:MAG: hypothetical protein EA392_14040 [Cryomorphaceae bacterium]
MKHLAFLILFPTLIAVTSACKSLVTLDDVKKQETKAKKATEEARKESTALADLKTQYSIDEVKRQIDALEKEQKAAKKDIKKLKGIATETAVGTTAGTLKTLEERSSAIDGQIKDLKAKQPENWDEAVRTISQDIRSINAELDKIMSNLR